MQAINRTNYTILIPEPEKKEPNKVLYLRVLGEEVELTFLETQQMIRDLMSAVFSLEKQKPACE